MDITLATGDTMKTLKKMLGLTTKEDTMTAAQRAAYADRLMARYTARTV